MKTERLGETYLMNCGMKATIIEYRYCKDIDVQFEDGTIVTNKCYADFTKGKIANPKLITNRPEQRIGETQMMNCDMEATIIDYRSNANIDVQFKDGTIVTNKCYADFKNGKIANPKLITNRPEQRIGKTQIMNCGMKATIIVYKSSTNIDIQFEDGTIVTNKLYDSFTKGKIKYPTKLRVNQKKMMNCGMEATIIAYRGCLDIDVKFTDGTIVTNKEYACFTKGKIANPKLITCTPDKRIGETRQMHCGMKATIIDYRTSYDMDIQFEDGIIMTNQHYNSFKRNTIGYPSFKPSEQIQQFTIVKQITPQYYLVSCDSQEIIQSTANLMALKYQEQELLSQEAI